MINGEKFNHYVGDAVQPESARKEIQVGVNRTITLGIADTTILGIPVHYTNNQSDAIAYSGGTDV